MKTSFVRPVASITPARELDISPAHCKIRRVIELTGRDIYNIERVRTRDIIIEFPWLRVACFLLPEDNPSSVMHLAEMLHDRLDVARFRVSPPAFSDDELALIMRKFTEPIPNTRASSRIVARLRHPKDTKGERMYLFEFEPETRMSLAHLFFAHIKACHAAYDDMHEMGDLPSRAARPSSMIGALHYNGWYNISADSNDNFIVCFGCGGYVDV